MMPPVSQGLAPRTAEPAGSGGMLAREHRAMITRIYEGTSQTQRVVMARQLQCPARSG